MGLTGISGPSGLSAIMGGGNGGGCSATINRSRQYAAASTQFHSVAHQAALSKGDTAWSAHLFAYLDSLPAYDVAFCKDDAVAGKREYILLLRQADVPGAEVQWIVYDGTSAIGTVEASTFGALATATWHHVKVWHDPVANVVGIRINNGTKDTAPTTGAAGTGTGNFYVGGRGSTLNHDGRIQQLMIFNSITSDADDTKIYNAGAGGDYANLGLAASPAQVWRANEASGNLIAAVGGINLADNNGVISSPGLFLSCAA